MRAISPIGGPSLGGTPITVTGESFQDLGTVQCRFAGIVVVASVLNGTRIECISPACTSPACWSHSLPGTQLLHVPLEVSMQGVSFTDNAIQFTFVQPALVGVSSLSPSGGPRAGGTRVAEIGRAHV